MKKLFLISLMILTFGGCSNLDPYFKEIIHFNVINPYEHSKNAINGYGQIREQFQERQNGR